MPVVQVDLTALGKVTLEAGHHIGREPRVDGLDVGLDRRCVTSR